MELSGLWWRHPCHLVSVFTALHPFTASSQLPLPSPPAQDSMYFPAFLLTVCTLLSALLVFRFLTCLFFSLYSLNISCNFSGYTEDSESDSSYPEAQTPLLSLLLSIFTWLSSRYLFLAQCAPSRIFRIPCLQSLSSLSFKVVRS